MTRNYKTLREYSAATHQDAHSVLRRLRRVREGDGARSGRSRASSTGRRTSTFGCAAGSKAVDAGVRLFNINDDVTGTAPDLGAFERGQAAAALRAALRCGPHATPRGARRISLPACFLSAFAIEG